MAGKQLEKVLKSIERQLFKLVLSHAFNLASLSVRISSIRNNSKSPTLSKFGHSEREELHCKKNCIRNNHSKSPHSPSPNFECEVCDRKKSIKKLLGQLHNIEI